MKYITHNSVVASIGFFSILLLMSLLILVPTVEAQSPAVQQDRGDDLSVPSCPFPAQAGRRIVHFDTGKRVQSDGNAWGAMANISSSEATSATADTWYRQLQNPIPAGTYTVRLATADRYADRVGQNQLNEQGFVQFGRFLGAGTAHTVLATSGTTDDLRDDIKSVLLTQTVNQSISFSQSIDSLRIQHAFWPEPDGPARYNSFFAICMALDSAGATLPAPTVTLQVRNLTTNSAFTNGTLTIQPGNQVALRWQSQNTTSCTATQGGFNTNGSTNDTTTTVDEPQSGTSQTYTVTCTNGSQNVSDSVVVSVQAGNSPTDPVTSAPSECPLTPTADRRVFHFLKNQADDATFQNKLRADVGEWNSWVNVDYKKVPVTSNQYATHMGLSTPIQPGTYKVTVVTWDNADNTDPGEQSVLEFRQRQAWDSSSLLYTSGVTNDLPTPRADGVMLTTVVNESLYLGQEINEIRGRHAHYPSNSIVGSHYMLCASLEPVSVTPATPGPGQCIDQTSGSIISIPNGYSVDSNGYCVASGPTVTATLMMRNDTKSPTGPYQANTSVSPLIIEEGDQVSLQWGSTNADSCSALAGSEHGFSTGGLFAGTDDTIVEPTAAQSVNIINTMFGTWSFPVSRQFSVNCVNNASSNNASASAFVRAVAPATPGPGQCRDSDGNIISIPSGWTVDGSGNCVAPTATPTASLNINGSTGTVSVPKGNEFIVNWSSTNTSSCSFASGNGFTLSNGPVSSNQSITTTPVSFAIGSSYQYQVTCTHSTGQVLSNTVTVNIIAPVPNSDITVTPNPVDEGDPVTVTWDNPDGNADACVVRGPGGVILYSGTDTSDSLTHTPSAPSATYTVVCTNATGDGPQSSDTVTVTTPAGGSAAPGSLTIDATPSIIRQGEDTIITWSADPAIAHTCEIIGGGQTYDNATIASGSLSITNVQAETEFTLICDNSNPVLSPAFQETATTRVRVLPQVQES